MGIGAERLHLNPMSRAKLGEILVPVISVANSVEKGIDNIIC